MVKKKLKIGRVIIAILILLIILACICVGIFFYELSPVDKKGSEISYIVESGSSVSEIYEDLESKNLIRNALIMKIYTKILGSANIEAGEYNLSPSMKAKEIYEVLTGGGKNTRATAKLTLKEGENIRDLGSELEKITDAKITKNALIEKLKDTEYLDTLINEYWFITDEIKDKDIYYSLEGYLFPNTYEIFKDSSVEEVIGKMLDETDKQLTKYKDEIEASDYSVHELLTLASIIELESPNSTTLDEETSTNESDRKTIAGIFTNRLNNNWSLGSCVTTYYAFGINMGDRDLTNTELNDCSSNKYNTRCTSFIGLPVGPIGNSGIKSIEAALNPAETDYYYFLSDKNGKVYYSKTLQEHDRIGSELRANGQMLYN